ncbi:hypothetical protein PBI_ROPE_2 [Mycobacterium phage Rope]|uniref:Uncharacterized protein n=1 Tax=Mycobacterium phage Rope TaxID=2767563 RepID=A0A7G9V057_9CAUD|nr:hypothetical protein PBI_ROPE_2 [Mycobacterium phage Rope]
MALRVRKGPGGIKVIGGADQVNPIERDPIDNTSDLERKVFQHKSKRKFPAPEASTPGRKVSAPPRSEGPLPS